jgi:hypothetical protein
MKYLKFTALKVDSLNLLEYPVAPFYKVQVNWVFQRIVVTILDTVERHHEDV